MPEGGGSRSSRLRSRDRGFESISRFSWYLQKWQEFSHSWRGNKRGFVPGFVPDGRTEDKEGVMFAGKPARSEKSFYSHRRATVSCRIAHPRRRKLWMLSARPGGKGRSRRVWRAMDRGAESDDRDQPPLSSFRASEVAQCSLFTKAFSSYGMKRSLFRDTATVQDPNLRRR